LLIEYADTQTADVVMGMDGRLRSLAADTPDR
jgi:hypothetical protein